MEEIIFLSFDLLAKTMQKCKNPKEFLYLITKRCNCGDHDKCSHALWCNRTPQWVRDEM